MKSLQSKLKTFGEGLAQVAGSRTYHYFRPQQEPPFTVWAENGEDGSFDANNHKMEQQIHGTIDYFTKTEWDPTVDAIQEYLNTLEGCGWNLLSVQHEDETGLIHYEWEWWLI